MTDREQSDEHQRWMQDGTDDDPLRSTGAHGPDVTPPHGDPLGPVTAATGEWEAEPATTPSFPWPPAENESVLSAFARTWQGATFQPARLFRAMPDVSIGAVLLYYLPLGILTAGVDLFWEFVLKSDTQQDTFLGSVTDSAAAVDPLVSFLMSPFILLLSLFLSAAFTHAVLKLLNGASRRFACTTAVFGFCYSPMLFGVVPVIGVVVGVVWAVVISIIGVREAHHTTTGRAAIAVLTPLVVLLFMVLMSLLLFAAAGSLLELPM